MLGTGLVDKARCKSKYNLRQLVPPPASSSASSDTPGNTETETGTGTDTSSAAPQRRRSTPNEKLAHQKMDQFNGQINTVFASPTNKHLAHSSSGEIIFLKTLNTNNNSDDQLPSDSRTVSGELSSSTVTVTVSHISVKNLVSKAYIGKGNPYVVISLGDMRLKTKVKWNESTATWSEALVFRDISKSLRTVGMLDVKVYDKERLGRKTLLGAVTLTIDGKKSSCIVDVV